MATETLEQMRARLDQSGVASEDTDFIVALVANMDKNPWLLPLSLMAMAETARRLGHLESEILIIAANESLLGEIVNG